MPFTIHRVTTKPVEDMLIETPRYGANADFHSKKNALQYTQRKNETILRYALIEKQYGARKMPFIYTEKERNVSRYAP